ncbi:amino acid adenylation domain-containing protein [Streptomyces sp. NPDC050560]|uniref:amino acid adenylation domain-containing protein n=1 Tax=Streptomyces sp. NPDC050560 TaxID=3365630 RepID=UPI0037AB2E19
MRAAAPGGRGRPFPLTETQQAYLLGRGDGYPLGNVSTHAYLEFEGPLDVTRFVHAWRRLVDRHGMLRAVIDPRRLEQRVLAEVPDPPVEIADLRGLPPAEVAAALAALRERLSHEVRPADRWPLFSVAVCLLGEGVCRVHVGFDGLTVDWASWHVMYRDLSAYYDDPDAELPPLAAGFDDYVRAVAEEGADGGGAFEEEDREFWRERLSALPGPPQLPLATDPDTVATPRFVRREALMEPARWAELKQRAAAAGLTPTGAVLAAYAEVVAQWSDGERFTLNVPGMNREPLVPSVGELVGEFASFTLVPFDRTGTGSFTARARALQRALLEGLEHPGMSGVRLLRELTRLRGGERASMPVVLTSTLALTGAAPHTLERALTQVYGITQTPQVHLDAQVEERRGALALNWDAVEELFPPGLLDTMFAAWTGLLDRLAADPAAWDADGAVPLPEQQRERRAAARGPRREIPDELVHDAFLRQAEADPGAPAVVCRDAALTRGELLARARVLAGRLAGAMARRPAAPVALLLEKGVEQPVAALAVLLAGGAYVPLEAGAPPARLRALLEIAAPSAVVTHAPLAGDVPPGPWRVLRADAPDDGQGADGAGVRADGGGQGDGGVRRGPGDLAYALFTSGTTGTPKAALIEHRGVVNCLRETVAHFGVGPGDRVLGLTPFHHDMALFDLFGVLGAGGVLVLPQEARRTDPHHWLDLARRHRVTVWNSVPAMMEMLLGALADAESRGAPLPAPADLRLAFLGGDWVAPAMLRELARRVPGARAVSVGGPTETTLWNIWHPVGPEDREAASVPYGRPLANTRYHLLDSGLRERPEGVVGEMYCSGPGLARGYLGDPEATAAAFVTHPRTGERLYRTGDLGRFRSDGVIEFVGRRDGQVQIAGRRVEPAEVEAALTALSGVAAAAVVPVPRGEGPGYRGLAAFVAGAHGAAAPDGGELRARLAGALPRHLVPGRFTVLDALPLTGSGKVDRAALARRALEPAAPADGAHEPSAGAGAPDDPLVGLLALTWAEALGVARVGPHDNFFELGGDSLVGARVLARLRAVFPDEELAPATLMATSDVTDMAGTLAAKEAVPGRMAQIAAVHLHVAALGPEELAAELAAPEAP